MSNLHVRDVMTPVVFTVGPDESIGVVEDLMRKKGIRHVPVVDKRGALLGVVSERDVLQQALFHDDDSVMDIIAWKVETVDVNENLSAAAQIMVDNKCGCLPVVDDGVLAGIITEADFVKSAAHAPPHPAAHRRPR